MTALTQATPSNELSVLTRYTKNRVIIVELFNQFSNAVLGFAAFIAIKSLDASSTEAIILTNGSQIVFILAYLFSTIMAGRSKTPFLIAAGILTRLSMVACAWVSGSTLFTIILCIAFFGQVIYIPAINNLGQNNYRAEHRGRVTGMITLWALLAHVVITLFVGSFLEKDPMAYQWLFPAAGITGFIAYYIASQIRSRRNTAAKTRQLRRSFRDLLAILKCNTTFLKFQLCFFIYGVGFMACMPTNILVVTQELNMSYQEFSVGILICSSLCIALLSPMSGRIFDKLGPTSSSALFFLLLALHPACMYAALHFQSIGLVYLAYILFGAAISGVNQGWLNGPMYYAGKDDSAVYMGIHMSNVGLRAIIGSVLVIIGNQATGGAEGTDKTQLIPHEVIYTGSIILFALAAICIYFIKSPPAKQ